jgi:hypothetical protein
MKIPPALLLLVLILCGGVAAFFLSGEKTAPVAEGALLSDRGKGGETVEDLKKQIDLLLGQNEYLQGQVQVLQDENAQLIQKLGTLGMKGGAQPAAMAADDGIAPDFVGMGVDMMKLRQIKALPLVTSPATEAEVEEVVLAWLRRLQPGDEAQRQARALAALGWIPQEIDPLPLRAKLLTRQLGGWYDSENDTMLVIDPQSDPPPSAKPDEPLAVAFGQLLREYEPILFQPQHGRLSTDERTARESLLAGDAGLTRFLFSIQNPKAEPKFDMPAEDPDHPLNQVPMPVFLREMAMFPFMRGFEFAQALHSAGEFPQLNAAYSRPPVSTAEVIEPELYLDAAARGSQVEVNLKSVAWNGVEPFWDDRLGKFACVTVLRAHNEDGVAAEGARGLLADRLLAWQAGADAKRHHAAWQTLFQDAESAQAYFKAMSKVLVERYGQEKAPEEKAGGIEFAAQDRFVNLKRNREGQGILLIDTATEAARKEIGSLIEGETK